MLEYSEKKVKNKTLQILSTEVAVVDYWTVVDCCALEHNGGILFQFYLRGTYHSVNFYHETKREGGGRQENYLYAVNHVF